MSDGDVSDGAVSDGDMSDGGVFDGGVEPVVEREGSEAEPRKSQRVRRRPNYYSEGASAAMTIVEEPSSFEEAVKSPNKARWKQAMEAEMRSLKDNDVWELVKLPENWKVVGSKGVFKVKVDGDGCVDRSKARLVAQGFSQTKVMDYDETFCLVVRMESLRTIVGLAARNGLKLHQLDVITASESQRVLLRKVKGT